MQTITMLGAFVLAIASLVSMTAAIMPETESSMSRQYHTESYSHPISSLSYQTGSYSRQYPTGTHEHSVPHIFPTPDPDTKRIVQAQLDDFTIPTPANAVVAMANAAGVVPKRQLDVGTSTFQTVKMTSAPTMLELKRDSCYVTTLYGAQDQITTTICPAAPAQCTPCVGCGVPQC